MTGKLASVDILVNNVGIFEPKPFAEISDSDWYRFFEVNVMSGVRLARHYLPVMLKRTWGRIIFISSESAVPNRIIMSPMTRLRADDACLAAPEMAQYYRQRASAGLIITEGAHPSPLGRGYTCPPGIHTQEQAAAWRKVTDGVHAEGGHIFVQLMHAGRVTHSSLLADHALPVAPSAIAVSGTIHTFDGKVPFETPRALETEEVRSVVADYRRAAELAVVAGFDGVELHAATGYLPHQFQASGSNSRTDIYGGSLENRTRFTLEVVEALCQGWGTNRVGIKIAPGYTVNDIFDEDSTSTYIYLAKQLSPLGLA